LSERLKSIAWFASSFLLIFVAWDVAVRVFKTPEYLVPPPLVVFASIAEHWRILGIHTLWTTGAIVAGFLLAALVAIPLAMVIVVSPTLGNLLYPPMVTTQAIPKIALAPLFIVWFGFGLVPKVAVAFLIAFFPIVIDTIVGLRSIDPGVIQLARSMGAPPYRVFLKLRLPNALPMIFSGLKVGSTLAVVGALTGEFVGSDKGLGYILLQASGNLNTALLFATLVVLSIVALAFFYLVELCERILIPWHVSQRAHQS
jgi:NitT/TauT family transport system permease protein